MISAQTAMYGYGIFLVLSAVCFIAVLILRKDVWNCPPIVSVHIFLAILCLFLGIVIIKQIEITDTMHILIIVAVIIFGIITFRLPARKDDLGEQKSK